MNTSIYVIACITALTFPALVRAQPVPIDNGDFQAPDVGSILLPPLGGARDYDYNVATTTYLNGATGWYVSLPGPTATGSSVTLVNQGIFTLLSPISGDASSQYLALNGLVANVALGGVTPGALGGISQVITTMPGQSYMVNYLAGALSVGAVTANQAVLSAGVDGVTVTSPSGGALVNLSVGSFNSQSFTFTATGASSTLDFYEPSALLANVGGVAIDDVSVTAVPEPSQSAALILGFAALIVAVRRFRAKSGPLALEE